jgi:hypothetical protein
VIGDPINFFDPTGLGLSDILGGIEDVISAPWDWAAGEINWVADETGLTDYANDVAAYYARIATDPNAPWLLRRAADVGGLFTSLVACDNLGDTTLTLTGGLGADEFRIGREYWIGKNFRLAPWGNRAPGRFHYPHYHRRIIGPNGEVVPGGSMKWYRPWQKGW